MPEPLRVSRVHLAASTPEQMQTGLLGYIAVVVNDAIALDGITLRRTAHGGVALSYPARRDSANRQHALVRVLGGARAEFERQVFEALALGKGRPPS